MFLAGLLVGLTAVAWISIALWLRFRIGMNFHQAMLYAPLKLFYRVDDEQIKIARQAPAPILYVVTHRAGVDPALMLSLLPSETLHILNPESAKSWRLEPFRSVARTIEFNTEHMFISRRLVRHLRGRGRLAVYIPENVEPSAKEFRLYRAIARIATEADVPVVPIFVDGYPSGEGKSIRADAAMRGAFPRLSINVLPPAKLSDECDRANSQQAANMLFDRLAEVRLAATDLTHSLFRAVLGAADRHGPSRTIIEDPLTGSLSYRKLFIAARALTAKLGSELKGDTIGVLLPNANGVVVTMLGLWSAGKAAGMVNYTAGPANVTTAIRTAAITTVLSSRAFIEKAAIQDIAEAVEAGGARIIWLEDVRGAIGTLDKLTAAALWRKPIGAPKAERPAVVLFTSGSEGTPKAVVLSHRNLLANAMQVETRIALSPADKLLNVLPVFHSYGLTGGTILPLMVGVHTFLYPSPLHFKLIPDLAKKVRPTIMFATDTFLAAYAKTADDDDFTSLRLVVAGAEPVKAETRRVWKERFGADLVEGFGMTEAAPVVSINTATHGRPGSVGRLMPGIEVRLEPVEGIDEGGRLWVSGPNVMMGYMTADKPGVLQPLEGMHDSGDIVTIDRDGFITIKGRAKRFAKIAGEMVSLGAVEMMASALWPEERHAVVAVPDKRRGERIVLVTTAEAAKPDALREYGKKHGVAELAVPGDIVKVKDLPVLGSGKTDYIRARKLALEALGLEQAA